MIPVFLFQKSETSGTALRSPAHRRAAILAIIDRAVPAERKRPLARASGRFACWNQKAVRELETCAQPSTLGAEIAGQIRLKNAESGPSETAVPSP